MYYAKVKDGDYIVGIVKYNTKEDVGIEIKEEEYLEILKIIGTRKKDQRLLEQDGKIFYVDVPGWDDREPDDPGKGGLTPDEAWKIIESSNISKENKQLLKDYIYKEG